MKKPARFRGFTLLEVLVVMAVIAMRLMSSLLFKVSTIDPVAYGAASIGLIAVALLASYLPSRRVSTVDPVEALRAE